MTDHNEALKALDRLLDVAMDHYCRDSVNLAKAVGDHESVRAYVESLSLDAGANFPALAQEIIDNTSLPPGFTSASYLEEALRYLASRASIPSPDAGVDVEQIKREILGNDNRDSKLTYAEKEHWSRCIDHLASRSLLVSAKKQDGIDGYADNEHGKVVLVARQREQENRVYTKVEFTPMYPHDTAFLKVALDKALNEYLLKAAGCNDENPEVSIEPLPPPETGERK
jgi:hypothetical protein